MSCDQRPRRKDGTFAILAEDLSKLYRIGLKESLPDTFAGAVKSWLTQPLRNLRALRRLDTKNAGADQIDTGSFWALRDVSFRIDPGQRIGIIGPNGAGKSTLLKILSRITEPTRGRALVRGRVGSLLEVGVGFHPELTGRENVFLSGAILGMRRNEIHRQFDEIVDFAELGPFIDTPVKRYSSGMFVRLAFAVAAHLETDILMVDEVLAVGDARFQKRCLGKMGEVASEGRTVLFVSHQLGLVRSLCDGAMLINDGQIVAEGPTGAVIERYLRTDMAETRGGERSFAEDREKAFQILQARLLNDEGDPITCFTIEEAITLELQARVRRRVPGLYGYMTVSRNDGTMVIESDSFDRPPNQMDSLSPGAHLVQITIPSHTLAPGRYSVYLNFTSPSGEQGFEVDSPGTILGFEVTDPFTKRGNERRGLVGALLEWRSTNG